MKTIHFTFILLAICSLAEAQTSKGSWLIGTQAGNFKYQNEGQYSQKVFSGSITPTAGYFPIDNLVVGTGVPVSYYTTYLKSPDFKMYQLSYGLSPFINYYFGKAPLKPYLGVAYSYNHTDSYSRLFLNGESKATGYSTVLAPTLGLAYFVTRHIGLNAGLSYNIQHIHPPFLDNLSVTNQTIPQPDNKYFSLDIGILLSFGK
ncbi:outer membrane beta-barrel protein [Spirosoma gilvum]